MKRISSILFAVGVVLLSIFFAPFKIDFLGPIRYGYPEYYIKHTNIFSTEGTLIVGRFFLYLTIWIAICYGLYIAFKGKIINKHS